MVQHKIVDKRPRDEEEEDDDDSSSSSSSDNDDSSDSDCSDVEEEMAREEKKTKKRRRDLFELIDKVCSKHMYKVFAKRFTETITVPKGCTVFDSYYLSGGGSRLAEDVVAAFDPNRMSYGSASQECKENHGLEMWKKEDDEKEAIKIAYKEGMISKEDCKALLRYDEYTAEEDVESYMYQLIKHNKSKFKCLAWFDCDRQLHLLGDYEVEKDDGPAIAEQVINKMFERARELHKQQHQQKK